jgi:hypothetical protein
VFTLLNLEFFNSENVKNKECVHTWANSTSYTSSCKHDSKIQEMRKIWVDVQWCVIVWW